MNACCSHENMTDKEIVQLLIEKNDVVTRHFFFEKCRPLFLSVMRKVFSYEVDYDEFVNEFYLYLMDKDAYRLRQFEGRSTIYQWLKITAMRFFIAKRDNLIDMNPKSCLSEHSVGEERVDLEKVVMAKIDLDNLFELMPNKRYVQVIKRLVLDDAEPNVVAEELNINVDNLYNIKKRALANLTKIALNEYR